MDEKKHRSWSAIVSDLVGNIADNISNSIQTSIAIKRRKMLKNMVAGALMLVGLVFLLTSLAMLINALAQKDPWVGYMGVGVIVLLVGAAVSMINNKN